MSWSPPKVEIGDVVLFRAHDNAEASMAFVTRVGAMALELWVLAPGYGGSERSSVHHKDDPSLAENREWAKNGSWEAKRDKIAILSERLAVLENRGNKK